MSYLERKQRELALLDRCLRRPLHPGRPESVAAAIEEKFRRAALLKADHSLDRWSITETARPPATWTTAGGFAFSFGYQRADLVLRGPPIYRGLDALSAGWRESTLYTGSGMGAIAALLGALLQIADPLDIVAPEDGYFESRELMRSLGPRLRVSPLQRHSCAPPTGKPGARVLWVDSSVRRAFASCLNAITHGIDLVAFDTTCFWRRSRRTRRVVRQAMRAGIPIVLVRSHGKLDSLGIEYGRLGSLVVLAPARDVSTAAARWTELVPKLRDAIRLSGTAPVLAHFPPFGSGDEYEACSALRTVSIIRSTRRLARALAVCLPARAVTVFQHGLYLSVALDARAGADEVKQAADAMAKELAAHGLPVSHAGSFGFDFVAMDWCPDALDGTDSMRIAGADLPFELSDEIARRIAAWLARLPGRSRLSLLPASHLAAA